MTDLCDKYYNSSSTFLSLNARLGAGVSKDSLRRFITSRCSELEQKQRFITSNSFILANFDNLDKNQSYSIEGSGKDESGFHGTTIQAVVPCHSSHSHTHFTIDSVSVVIQLHLAKPMKWKLT